MAEKNMNAKISVEFEETANRQQLSSGDNLPTLFGKIKKIISDLANVCFSGSYNDLSDTPDVVTKEYVDSKVAFYDGRVSRSTNTDTTNCWVKIAECEAPNSTAQIMDEITLYPNTTDSAVKTTCKVRVEGKGAYANTWKLHIIDSTKDFNSNKVKLIYDKNIVDDKRKIELWGYNINGWDGFHSQKTFGNNYTLTYGLKCLTSQNKFATTYLHDNFAEAPTIDISIKSLVNEGLTSLENNIALNRTTLGYQCKNLLKNNAVTKTVSGITFTVNDDKSITVNGTNSTSNYVNLIVFQGELETGTYILSGAVSDVFRIRLGLGTTDVYGSYVGVDRGNGYTFTVAEKALYTVTCQVESGKTASNVIFKPMLRYADIIDDTYEPYQPSVQEQINNFGTQQQLLCDYSSAATSSVTIQITGLFSNYSAVICIVKYYLGTTSITLPLKYIKSIGTSKEYSPISELGFKYIDDDNLLIGGADAAISSVKIISLY